MSGTTPVPFQFVPVTGLTDRGTLAPPGLRVGKG
jgi:hypothetical protein